MKMLVMCLDGLDPDMVTAHLDRMPTLAGLMPEAIVGPVHSPSLSTPVCWASFSTGLRPKGHGIKGHGPTHRTYWTNRDVNTKRFLWTDLQAAGLTFGVSRIPIVTRPPGPPVMKADGHSWMITGDAGIPQGIWPPDLSGCLEPYVRPKESVYHGDDVIECWPVFPQDHPITWAELRAVRNGMKDFCRVKAARNYRALLCCFERRPVDVVIAYWHDTDFAGHHLLYDQEAIGDLLQQFDGYLKELVDRWSPERIAVIADHGMVPYSHPDAQRMGVKPAVVGGHQFWKTSSKDGDTYFSGFHRLGGFGLLWGQGFAAGEKKLWMIDLMPTLLASLGLDVDPKGLDGQVDYEVLGPLTDPDPSPKEVEDRLRSLGYI